MIFLDGQEQIFLIEEETIRMFQGLLNYKNDMSRLEIEY